MARRARPRCQSEPGCSEWCAPPAIKKSARNGQKARRTLLPALFAHWQPGRRKRCFPTGLEGKFRKRSVDFHACPCPLLPQENQTLSTTAAEGCAWRKQAAEPGSCATSVVEQSTNVQIQHPVHSLPGDPCRQHAQRSVLVDTLPTSASAYASCLASRRAAQNSRSGCLAIPFLRDFFILYLMPVYPSARGVPRGYSGGGSLNNRCRMAIANVKYGIATGWWRLHAAGEGVPALSRPFFRSKRADLFVSTGGAYPPGSAFVDFVRLPEKQPWMTHSSSGAAKPRIYCWRGLLACWPTLLWPPPPSCIKFSTRPGSVPIPRVIPDHRPLRYRVAARALRTGRIGRQPDPGTGPMRLRSSKRRNPGQRGNPRIGSFPA